MKKYLFIAALLLTTGIMFAFNSGDKQTKSQVEVPVSQFWYDFIGGDENDPNRYVLRDPQTAPSCTIGTDMCAVKAVPNPNISGKPDLTDPTKEVRREN